MAQGIEIVRGTTNTLEINVVDADGVAYTAPSTAKIIFGVKKKASDDAPLFVKVATIAGAAGQYQVTLDPADTEALEFGRYLYDVGLQSGATFHNIIPPAPFEIVANVTKWGCAD